MCGLCRSHKVGILFRAQQGVNEKVLSWTKIASLRMFPPDSYDKAVDLVIICCLQLQCSCTMLSKDREIKLLVFGTDVSKILRASFNNTAMEMVREYIRKITFSNLPPPFSSLESVTLLCPRVCDLYPCAWLFSKLRTKPNTSWGSSEHMRAVML